MYITKSIILKDISDEEPSTLFQNVKKPAKECSFLRRCLLAACSFIANKTPSKVFFTVFFLMTKHVTVIKLTVVAICLLLTRTRSSHWRCSVRKCVFRNFAKFIAKYLYQSLYSMNNLKSNFHRLLYLTSLSLVVLSKRRCFYGLIVK